jgi:hypothetical protein
MSKHVVQCSSLVAGAGVPNGVEDGPDFDINDFIRFHLPGFSTHWQDRIATALANDGLVVFTVECGPRGVWQATVQCVGPADYGAAQAMEDRARKVLRRIGVLRPRCICTIFPVGKRWGIGFCFKELPVRGVRYRLCRRNGQIVECRESYQPLLRGHEAG